MSVQTPHLTKAESKTVRATRVEEVGDDGLDVRRFVANFDVLAEAAGGVAGLRGMVIELAMRGKLTRHAPSDGTAGSLLEQIDQDVAAHGRPRVANPDVEQPPFDVPAPWRWVHWGRLVRGTSSGWSPQCESRPRTEGEWGVLKVSAVSWVKFDPQANKALPLEIAPRPEFAVRNGDFLMSRANTAELVGRSVVVDEAPPHLIISDKIIRCEFSKWADKGFINLYNRTSSARAHYITYASGTSDSMKNIAREVILSMPIPLPPLAEQKRIVAKVDQLMALCDELEARQRTKRETGSRLTKSALEALTTAEGPEEFNAAWKRVVENFDVLIDRAGKVGELRRLVLALALQGRLSHREKSDGSVLDLLERVKTDRTWRIEERPSKIRVDPKIEALVGVTPVPEGWAECRLNDFAQLINGRAYAQPELLSVGTPVIRIQNLNGGKDWYYSDLTLPDRQYCDTGDLLFAWSASFGPYIWAGEKAIYHYHIWKLNLSGAVDKRFLYFSLSHITEVVREQSHGLAMLHMTKGQMERWPILLPPVAEQVRIVAKVEQLMKVCDDLEGKLHRSEDRATRLVDAVIRELGA